MFEIWIGQSCIYFLLHSLNIFLFSKECLNMQYVCGELLMEAFRILVYNLITIQLFKKLHHNYYIVGKTYTVTQIFPYVFYLNYDYGVTENEIFPEDDFI